MSVFSHKDFDGHQQVSFRCDEKTGLKAIIAVHNNNLGPALGGCRMFDYNSDEEALSDVLRLSRGMTYKSAMAGLPLGGGKSVIIGNPRSQKNRELLLAMGDFVESLGGAYVTAEDSGTGVSDMRTIAERTAHVSGVDENAKYGGDPSPSTAYGVYKGIEAAVAFKLKSDLRGVRVAIQGVGNVGYHLARFLSEAGAEVFGADINEANLQKAEADFGLQRLPLPSVLGADVDVLAPCAMGGAVSYESVHGIRASIVAGAANNQLAQPEQGEILMQKGVLYAPDFVINAGGIIDAYYQFADIDDRPTMIAKIEEIGATLTRIFELHAEKQICTAVIAEQLAEEKFKA